MSKIELKKYGNSSLESTYLRKDKDFIHYTGNKIKILPFKTNPGGKVFVDDFKSFQGIVGELYRILDSKQQIVLNNNEFKIDFKEEILQNAIRKVDTENEEELKDLLTKLFFNEENSLIKFNIKTLFYMNFISEETPIKEVSKFINDVFISEELSCNSFNEEPNNENLLHRLILESLPNLPELDSKVKKNKYFSGFSDLQKLFIEDFTFLQANNSYLLKHVEDFIKYYYFQYLSQMIMNFNSYGNEEEKVKPIYFSMDWETLSESRLSNHTITWKKLNSYAPFIFAHVNTIELLNYISYDGVPLGYYTNVVSIFESLPDQEKEELIIRIKEVVKFYTDNITLKGGSWEECESLFKLNVSRKEFNSSISKEIYYLWYVINYQFSNTDRKNADVKYGQWFSYFVNSNYTKYRGRLGNTMVLSQDRLLFLTRICIGNEEKIKLKLLWDKFHERGIVFDEITKSEITKLFEKINLIEKKSDSGDAQYVKSNI